MEVRRINPEAGVVREIIDLRRRVRSQETRASGNIVVRETLTAVDPDTGVETIIGLLPDGTYGFQPFVGDIIPPPVATAPTATAQPGLMTVRWDGKFVADAAKPRDFEQVNVIGHKIVDGVTVSSATIGLIRNKDAASYINEEVIAEDETWQFSLESEDYNGNKAALSARSPIITMIGIMSPALVEDKLQELRDEDTALSDRADQTQDALADAQALADALLAKGQNLAINGDFDVPLVAGKPVTGWPSFTLSSIGTTASVARTGTQYLRAAPLSTPAYAYTNDVSSASGRIYRAEYWAKLAQTATVTDGTTGLGFLFTTTDLDGTVTANAVTDTTVPVASLTTSTWVKVTKDYTVTSPANKIKFGPRVTGNGNVYYIDSFKVTDVTEALAAQQKADSAFANAQQAATAAGTAQTSADTKNRNWYQATAPAGVSHKDGDTWFDTDDDNRIYIWNATAGPLGTGAWIDMRDKAIEAANTIATGAQATADGKNKNYYNATKPTGGTYKDGDQWFDTGNGNKLYLWKTASNDWIAFQDAAIASLNVAVTAAKASADGKTTTYYQTTQPSGGTYIKGDIWIDTDDNYKMYMYPGTGTTWTSVQDSNGALLAANGKNKSTMAGTAPSSPATGDIWIDTANGNQIKTWNGAVWSDARDTSIAAAAAAATAAQTSANGKNKNYYQTSMPTGGTYILGDTWFDTDDGNKVYIHNGSTFIAAPFGTNAIANQAITNAQIFDATIQAAKIGSVDAGTITVGTLSANRIGAGTVTAEKLTIGVGPNILLDPALQDATLNAARLAVSNASVTEGVWSIVAGEAVLTYTAGTHTSAQSVFNMRSASSGSVAAQIPVTPGAEYRLTTEAFRATGTTPQVRYAIYYKKTDGSFVYVGDSSGAAYTSLTVDGWQTVTRKWVAPADAVFAGFDLQTNLSGNANGLKFRNPSVSMKVDGSLIVDGSIVAGSAIIADGAIGNAQITNATITSAKISEIDAGKIQSGFIDAQRIDAGSISANKLAVGDFANLLDDPSFEAGPVKSPWVVSGGATIQTDSGRNNTMVLRSNAGRTATIVGTQNGVRLATNDSFVFRMWLYINVTTTSAGQIKVLGQYKNKAGTVVNTVTLYSIQSGTTSGWKMYESTPIKITDASIETMTVQLSVDTAFTGLAIFDDLEVRRQTGATLIEQGAITTNHITSSGLDAGAITAGTLTALQIQSGAITADKMLLTSFDNLVENGSFEYGMANWPTTTSWSLDTVNGRVTPNCLKVTGITVRAFGPTSSAYIPIEAGDQDAYRLSGWVKTTATSGDVAELCMYYYDGTKTFVSNSNLYIPTASTDSTWRFFSKLFYPPAGVAYFRVRPNATMTNAADIMYFDDISVNKAVGADLIVDGAITTQHMTSGTIDASVLTAGSVKAVQLGAKSITTDKLIVSSSNNLLIEPDFSLNGISWTTSANISINATAGRGSTPALRFTGTTSALNSYNLIGKGPDVTNKIAVDSDNRFRASFWVKSTEALPVNAVKLAMRRYTTGSAQTATTMVGNDAVLVPNVWTQFEAVSPALAAGTNGVGSIIALDFYLIVDNLTTGGITDIDAVSVTRAADGKLVVDGSITSTKLETNLVLATKIIAGSETGTHAAMEPTGFKVYAADPGGGAPVEVVRLGVAATDDYFAITKSNGDLAASISQDGVMSALDVNASRALFYKGNEMQSLLDDMPRGVIAAAYRDTNSAVNGGTTNGNIPFLRLEAYLEAGRIYRISTSPLRISRDAGASVTVGIKYNSTGTATTPNLATVTSPDLAQSIVWDEANSPVVSELFALTSGSSKWVSFLIWLGALSGNAGFRPSGASPARLIVEDVGPNRNTIGSGVSVDGNATPPAAKNTYTKQYNALGSSSYQGNGTVYSFDAGRMYQGLSPAGYGNMKSLAYFPSFTGDLSGAIVNNIRVYFMFDHWYYNSGGTARITLHGQSGLPATFPTTYGTPAVSSGGWPKPGDRWVTIPSSYYGGFVNGTYKGVALEGDSTYGTYGIAQRPVIEISYTK